MKECQKCGVELSKNIVKNEDDTICSDCTWAMQKADSSTDITPYISIIISGVAFFMTWYFSGRGVIVEFFGAEAYFAADWVVDMILPVVVFVVAICFAVFTVPKKRKKLKLISVIVAVLSLAASMAFLLLL